MINFNLVNGTLRRLLIIALGLAFIWVLAIVLRDLPSKLDEINGRALSVKVAKVRGLMRPEVEATLGQPYRVLSRHEYDSRERKDIAVSFEPDPPIDVPGDEILMYREGLRLVALFLVDNRVVHIWEGLT